MKRKKSENHLYVVSYTQDAIKLNVYEITGETKHLWLLKDHEGNPIRKYKRGSQYMTFLSFRYAMTWLRKVEQHRLNQFIDTVNRQRSIVERLDSIKENQIEQVVPYILA